MTRSDHRPLWPYLVIYFFAVAMPSAAIFQKRVNTVAAIAFVGTIAVFTAILPRIIPLVVQFSRKLTLAVGVATLIVIIATFAVVYPKVNTQEPGQGSDRDDALNVGVNELLHGRYPYHAKTYLGAPISPGPGALVQSVPFWLLGNAAYQNFFWLPVFVAVAAMILKDLTLAIVMTLLTIFVAPSLIALEVLTGGDYFANSLYVLTAACLVLMSRTITQTVLSGALLGLLLSSRANYLFIVPILLAHVWKRDGVRAAVACGVAILTVLLAISLPFYLHDPKSFGPLAAQNKFAGFEAILPHADAVVAITLTLLTIALLTWLFIRPHYWSAAIACCAIVLIYPSLFGVVLDCLQRRRLDFAFAGWAASGTAFAMLALAGATKQNGRLEDEPPAGKAFA